MAQMVLMTTVRGRGEFMSNGVRDPIHEISYIWIVLLSLSSSICAVW